MDQTTKKQLELRTNIIKALAHPARLLVVQTLAEGERCVCELTELIGYDMSTVSKHLTLLRNAGIIEDDKRSNKVFYKLKTPCVLNFLNCIERVLEESQQETVSMI
ncbi:metalloregulator ArsR/SmtB family transcription factor [bacterium]|nr:metalloregulator ArsR/SmtB family transcription factor [bacterium]